MAIDQSPAQFSISTDPIRVELEGVDITGSVEEYQLVGGGPDGHRLILVLNAAMPEGVTVPVSSVSVAELAGADPLEGVTEKGIMDAWFSAGAASSPAAAVMQHLRSVLAGRQ